MQKFDTLRSKLIPLPHNNIDTDQIIPARYLKVTDKSGLAEGLFTDWRYEDDGSPKEDFVLNDDRYQEANILLAGDNFGCGSSREHAPWALVGWGVQAVVSTSFADIFKSNALKNGLLPVVVDEETHQSLFDLTEEAPDAEVHIDLGAQEMTLPDGSTVEFPVDAFAKSCLLAGVDQLGYIQSFDEHITSYEQERAIFG
ncbi:MAG: 3-isopropylmalate dehydratase small subunit [Chloroflexi bacterium]|nr:MAG: 3-isopropylmalate dehydratase small subunit [Chloroflexota bacterium]MBL1193959.1 3-isopropylmalate dehydratase small subunit [Chloroflexota bacterium]NOH11254.1 3-isopropylmalate dehydratase small subunit [Chloroflexota bacterium]